MDECLSCDLAVLGYRRLSVKMLMLWRNIYAGPTIALGNIHVICELKDTRYAESMARFIT